MAGRLVNLGMIGAGRWGQNYIRTISALDGVRLAMIASRNPSTAELVSTDCRIVNDWRKIIEAVDVDGVIIATPPDSHAEILVAAVEAGKPVLLEKPAVRSQADVKWVRSRLDKLPATILVDHTHLFHPAFRALHREAARHGPIRSIRSSAGNFGPYRADVPVLWDWAAHDIAMCLTLVQGPARALRSRRLDARLVDHVVAETLAIELELATGIHAQIKLSTLVDRHRWFAVDFDSCTLVYRDQGPRQLVSIPAGADVDAAGVAIPFGDRMPLTQVVIDFVEAVRSKSTDLSSINLGLDVVEIIASIDSQLGTA